MTTQQADPITQQADAIAEALLPQMDSRIQARLDAQVAAFDERMEERLRDLGVVDEHGDRLPPPEPQGAPHGPFTRLGDQLQAIRLAARPGVQADPRLMQIFAATGLSEGIGADGGFLVQTEFSSELQRLIHDTGVVWGRIPDNRKVQLGANANALKIPGIDEQSRVAGSRWGGIRAYRTAEAGTLTASRPKFRQIALELMDLFALIYATSDQLEDTPSLEALLMAGMSEEFGFKLDDELINGAGDGAFMGILEADCTISVAKETGQAAASIVFQNIVKMWSRMWARSRGNAVWFINQDVEPQLFSMSLAVGTGGIPVYLPAGGLSGSPFGTLMGRPVVPIEQCATLGTVGDIILADMSQYWAIEKGGVRNASSIHVQFLTAETAFRAQMRNDAQPGWMTALTPAKGSNTVSPFVTLATRA